MTTAADAETLRAWRAGQPTPIARMLKLYKQAGTAINQFQTLVDLTEKEIQHALGCLDDLASQISIVKGFFDDEEDGEDQ